MSCNFTLQLGKHHLLHGLCMTALITHTRYVNDWYWFTKYLIIINSVISMLYAINVSWICLILCMFYTYCTCNVKYCTLYAVNLRDTAFFYHKYLFVVNFEYETFVKFFKLWSCQCHKITLFYNIKFNTYIGNKKRKKFRIYSVKNKQKFICKE